MEIVKHQKLKATLSTAQKESKPNLFFIYGESFLAKKAFQELSDSLLGKDRSSFALEKIDGLTVPLGDIIEQVSTFSFPAAKKIFAVNDIPLFTTDKNSSQIRYTESDFKVFEEFILNGWPQDHILILLSPTGDKRKKIFKTIAKMGWVIDCTVPQGARKADQEEQLAVLRSISEQVLNKYSKELDPQAFSKLVELTGFNLDLFTQNLEKLSAFTANRSSITINDVSTVVVRDKKDPIFSLTNALMEKNAKSSLFYLNTLVQDGFHPLQILKSFENLFRKLLYVKDLLAKAYPDGIQIRPMAFNQFKQSILPLIVKSDNKKLKTAEDLELFLTGNALKKKDVPKELSLAPNPKNAYPVFQTFKQSDNYSLTELCHIILFLSDLDYDIKTSSVDVLTQIENFILKLCSKGGFVYAQENQNHRYHL